MTRPLITRPGQTPSAAGRLVPPSDHEAITNAARGIPDRADTTLAFNAGTRTFTIAPVSGAFSYYIAGRRYVKSAAESIVIADTSGVHWIYYDGATLSEIIDPDHDTATDLIINKVRIGLIYWNVTDGAEHLSGDDRHGAGWPGTSQVWAHALFGMVWHTGLDLSGYTLDTDTDVGVSFELSDGIVHDEDVEHDIVDGAVATHYAQQLNGGNAEVPILYRDDVDGSWTEDAATDLPWKLIGAGQRLAYNNHVGGGVYGQTEIAANKFVNAFLYVTNDWKYPVKVIQGQNEHASKAAAVQAVDAEIIALGDLPSPEMVLLYGFSLQTNDPFGGTNNCKIVAVTDFRQRSRSGGLAAPPAPHAILSNTHTDSLAATVVRGDLQIGNATPEWSRVALGAADTFLGSDGTDAAWNNTVVTAAAVIADNAVIRGDGGSRGSQGSDVFITDAGRLGIGTTDPTLYGANTMFAVHREAASAGFVLAIESDTATHQPTCQFRKARGDANDPDALQSGDRVAAFLAAGHDGTEYRFPASIRFVVDGAVTTSNVPIAILFETGVPGRLERMRIGSDGDILIDADTMMRFRDPNLWIGSLADGQLTFSADDLLLLDANTRLIATHQMQYRDSAIYTYSSVDGQMDHVADVEIELTAPTVDLTAATAVIVRNVHGINYAPGSDTDCDLATVDVSGGPKFWWDESEDSFAMTKGLILPGLLVPVATIAGATTLTRLHTTVLCDASGGAFTVTLPAVSGNARVAYSLKKIDASANAVTIDGDGAETIDDAATKVLAAQYDSIDIVCDGTEWWVVGR